MGDRGGYGANFQRSGQSTPIIVFDDSSVAHEKYYGTLESTPMLDSARSIHARVLAAMECARTEERRAALGHIAVNLSRTFYNFEPDFFQQNVSRRVDNEVGLIRSALEIWPTRLEIVYFKKNCRQLPLRRVRNRDPLRAEKAATI